MYPTKLKDKEIPKLAMSDIRALIVECSHCKKKLSSEEFENHRCELQLVGQKTIPVVYFLDTSYSGKKHMTGWGTDGVLYTFEVVPRKAMPIVMYHPTKVNMNLDSDDKLPVPCLAEVYDDENQVEYVYDSVSIYVGSLLPLWFFWG